MYSHGLSTRKVQTHSPVIMQSVKSTQVQKPVLQTATGVATGSSEMTSSLESSQQNQQVMMSAQAVVAKSTGGIVQHGIATSVALPLSQQSVGVTNLPNCPTNIILNSNNANSVSVTGGSTFSGPS